MVVIKTAAGDVTNKKDKGLKDHKKAQREKALSKRTAAAEKAKIKHAVSYPAAALLAKDSVPIQEEAASKVDVACEKAATISKIITERQCGADHASENLVIIVVIEDEVCTLDVVAHTTGVETDLSLETNTKSTDEKSASTTTTPQKSFDIVAHRKTLEAALYENMETPRQMLNRCKCTSSVDAEYHPKGEHQFSDDLVFEDLMPKVKCFDANGFDVAPLFAKPKVNNTSTGTEVKVAVDRPAFLRRLADQ